MAPPVSQVGDPGGIYGGGMATQNSSYANPVGIRGMAGGAVARAAQASQRVEAPVSTMTLGSIGNFVDIGTGLGLGLGVDPLSGAGRKSGKAGRRGSGAGGGKISMGQSQKPRGFVGLGIGGYAL